MGEKPAGIQEERVCERIGVACAAAGGERCGIDVYLGRMSPQIREAMRARIKAQAARHPESVERRCADGLQMGKVIIAGVMGPGEGATTEDEEHAFALGKLIAHNGWVLLTGGRPVGVMAAANRGAKAAGGLTVGILPSRTSTPENTSADVDIAIPTGLGDGRNAINVLTSDVVMGFR